MVYIAGYVDDRDFYNAVGLEEAECVGVKQRVQDLQEWRRAKRLWVPDTVSDAVKLAGELL